MQVHPCIIPQKIPFLLISWPYLHLLLLLQSSLSKSLLYIQTAYDQFCIILQLLHPEDHLVKRSFIVQHQYILPGSGEQSKACNEMRAVLMVKAGVHSFFRMSRQIAPVCELMFGCHIFVSNFIYNEIT